MDLKALGKDLNALQSRQEKFEDALLEGKGDKKYLEEMVTYYRGEAAKVRAKYLELVGAVRAELTGD